MRIKHLLSFCLVFCLFQWAQAQQMKPAEPALRARLMKYAADNHLYPGQTYVYWDSVSKTPYRFSPKDFLVEDRLQPTQMQSIKPSSPQSRVLEGGNFHLVNDINTLTNANPSLFTVLNNTTYFTADDGIHGAELWKSDGTAEGTILVKDITAGTVSSNIINMTSSNNYVFFDYYNTVTFAYELWKSDGTESGTGIVFNFPYPPYYNLPDNLCDVNGTLYFTLSLTIQNDELWKTDGTQAGTVLVKDFGKDGGYNLRNLVSANGALYFVAPLPGYGSEIWKSDGTEGGTQILKDINPDSTDFYNGPSRLTVYQNKIYFAERDDNNLFDKLWVTDGTTGGTRLAPGYNGIRIVNISYAAGNQPFTVSSGNLYFTGNAYATGTELYRYDVSDTLAGIQLVKDLVPGTDGITLFINDITEANGNVFFLYADTALHLYKTNGTADSTIDLKDFDVPVLSSLFAANNNVYFTVYTNSSGYEPWVSDGTTEGTVLLEDIYADSVSSYPAQFTLCNGKILFTATGLNGNEIYYTNGKGAQLLKDINTTATANAGLYYFKAFDDGVIAYANTFDKGAELWTANSTNASLVKDVMNGQRGSSPRGFFIKNNIAYFIADTTDFAFANTAVYKTDGTTEGTVRITPFVSGNIIALTVTDNGTIFYVVDYSGTQELYRSNGTMLGTYPLHTFLSFIYSFSNNDGTYITLTSLGNNVYFGASDQSSSTGAELWKSDGTYNGTIIVKDINPGAIGSSPDEITAYKGKLYFSASANGTDRSLWMSDGTNAGTELLNTVSPSHFRVSNNKLFFAGATSDIGSELWKTDGTSAGTVLVKDILTGQLSSMPSLLTDVNGILFFQAVDSLHGSELWKSNGTETGTQLVKDITPGNDNSSLQSMTSSANKLFFIYGNTIWASDGTSEGTNVIADAGLSGISPYTLVANGNQLFFSGYSYQYGVELYAGNASQVVLPVTLASFTAALKGSDVLAQWQTASEINTSYFNLQRSTDGIHFTDASKVMAKGSGTYAFTDVNIANLVSVKTIYYRLQTVDKDGSTSLSKVAPVNLNLREAVVLLLPNPVKDKLKIRVSNFSGKAAINVFDANGKNVYSTQQTVQNVNDFTITTSSLQSGVYMVKIILNRKTVQKKFIKE